jgi:hypothetical protein
MRVIGFAMVGLLALTGCAGKFTYVRPTASAQANGNVKVIDKPRDVVWAAAVPELGKQFFVINNLDKSSGLINVSYSGDPRKYVDCGQMTSYVKNARGERTYSFPAASANETYETMTNGHLLFVNRRMELDGRMNLIFEEVGPNQTRVSANTRYIVKRDANFRDVEGRSANRSDSVSFNSNSMGTFAGASEGNESPACVANGELEREVLSVVR